jgi:hypothetical protein
MILAAIEAETANEKSALYFSGLLVGFGSEVVTRCGCHPHKNANVHGRVCVTIKVGLPFARNTLAKDWRA